MANLIGGEKWRSLVRAFEASVGRPITKKERRFLEKEGGFFTPSKKTKGRAMDILGNGSNIGTITASESLRGGMAADNDAGLVKMRLKAGRLSRPVTAN